ncbi:hypothetical protein QOT17_008504 [Balamuthia mandrillaris]
MSLPCVSSYVRYKQNNSRVARWLWTAYEDCRALLSSRAPSRGGGKGRKKAAPPPRSSSSGGGRGGAAEKESFSPLSSTKLSPDDLRRILPLLKKAIANGVLEVPSKLFSLLRSTIQARLHHHEIYVAYASALRGKERENVEKQNRCHKFYVEALQEAFEELGGKEWLDGGCIDTRKTKKGAPKQQQQQKDANAPATAHLRNYYELLVDGTEQQEEEEKKEKVEHEKSEGNQWLEGMLLPNNNKPRRQNNKQNRKKQQQRKSRRGDNIPLEEFEIASDVESFFAAVCLLNDVSALHHWVKGVWKDYTAGTLSLTAATQLTNAAVQQVAQMENEFYVMFSTPARPLSCFYDILDALGNLINVVGLDERSLDRLSEWLYLVPFVALTVFLQNFQVDFCLPSFGAERKDFLPVRPPTEEIVLQLGYWASAAYLTNHQFYWEKPMVGLMRQVRGPEDITLRVLFAEQAYLDCLEACQQSPSNFQRAYQEMQVGIEEVFSDVEWYVNHDFQYSAKYKDNRDWAKLALNRWKCIIEDPIHMFCEKRPDVCSAFNYRRGDIFLHNPWIAGCCLLHQQSEFYFFTVNVIRGTGLVMAMLHLYHALVVTKLMPAIPALEQVMQIFGARFFRGLTPPTDPYDCYRTYCYALGLKLESLVTPKGGQDRLFRYHTHRVTLFEEDSLVYFLTEKSKLDKKAFELLTTVTAANNTNLLSSSADTTKEKRKAEGEGEGEEEEEGKQEDKRSTAESGERGVVGEQTDSDFGVTVSTLQQLKAYLQSQKDPMHFNMLAIHKFSIEILKKLHTTIEKELTEIRGADAVLHNEHDLPYVVRDMFKVARMIPFSPTSESGRMWAKAAASFQEVVSTWDLQRRFFLPKNGL